MNSQEKNIMSDEGRTTFHIPHQHDTRVSVLILAVTILLGLALVGVLYIYDEKSLLYYGDSVSRLVETRRLVDSTDFRNYLNLVWLPLPHLILLPFSLIGFLFSSGLAGLINLPLHAITSVLLYKIIKNQTKRNWIALICSILYATNLNLLYLGVTAMSEVPFLLFFVASIYFLQKWTINGFNVRYILFGSICIALATLCRYEAYILAPLLIIFVIFFIIKKNITSNKFWIVLAGLVSFSGIIFWIGLNYVIFQNLLEFATDQFYSASSQAVERPYRDSLYLQPHNVIYIYGMAAMMILGPILVFAVGGYFAHFKEKLKSFPTWLYFFLSLPVLFTLFTMVAGIAEMSQWWFNSRFATFVYPLAIILTAFCFLRLEKRDKKKLVSIAITGLFIFQLASSTFGVVTYIDAHSGWIYKQSPFAVQTSNFLYENYDHGKVLMVTGSAQAHKIMILSEIDLINFNDGIENNLQESYFKEPWNHNKWFIIGLEPDSDSINAAQHWSENINLIYDHYELVYENQYYKIFKLQSN